MLYWRMDLRYREIASEWLYVHYLDVMAKMEALRSHHSVPSKAEREYDDLHCRMSIFDPNVKQLKREENMRRIRVVYAA